MKTRILLLMGEDASISLSHLQYARSGFTFVYYEGKLDDESVRQYLQTKKDQFDAVAVFDDPKYDPLNKIVKTTDLPKIMFTLLNPNAEGFVFTSPTITRPTEFDRLVKKHFKEL